MGVHFLVLILCIALALLMGSLLGFVIGFEEGYAIRTSTIKTACNACDTVLKVGDAMFCERCLDEDDKLTSAIKEKESRLTHEDLSLRKRNSFDRPDQEELAALRMETFRVDTACVGLKNAARELNVNIDVNGMEEKNRSLAKSIDKWSIINQREEKMDKLLKKEDESSRQMESLSLVDAL